MHAGLKGFFLTWRGNSPNSRSSKIPRKMPSNGKWGRNKRWSSEITHPVFCFQQLGCKKQRLRKDKWQGFDWFVCTRKNKLLLVSIHFTPKTSHPVASKNGTNSYVFQVFKFQLVLNLRWHVPQNLPRSGNVFEIHPMDGRRVVQQTVTGLKKT